MRAPHLRFVWRAPMGALAVVVGMIACSGIITGPDAGPDTSPRRMSVSPARLELSLTDTARMSANLYDVTGAAAVLDPSIRIRFRTGDSTIARVDSTGLVTAIADGTTTVTASYGALQLGIPVVVLGRPRLLVVSGNAQTAEQGDTLPLPIVVRALDAVGTAIAGASVTFAVTSGNGTLASVQGVTDGSGLASARWVLGLPLGAQRVRVTSAGLDSAAFDATATAGTRAARIVLQPLDTTLVGPGIPVQLAASVRNVADAVLATAPVTWVSTVPAVATVSPTGLVTSVAPGVTHIRATSGTVSDSTRVTVLALPVITVTPTTVALTTPAGSSPAATTIAVTNSGGSRLSGLSASVVYGAGATGWLALAFDSTAAPATLTLTPSTATVPVGGYTATITIASSVAGVVARTVNVTLDVTSVGPLPKLQLGNDLFHPIGLQAVRRVDLPAPAAAPLVVTLRSLDVNQLLIAPDSVTLGGASMTVALGAGQQTFAYWMQGVADGFPDARVVAEAPGYEPDTIEVVLSAPAVRLTLITPNPVPATGGPEPVLQVTVGYNDEGTLVPMAVRAFGPAPVFSVASAFPDFAQMRFRATAATNGTDQGPATSVSFELRPGRSATSLPDVSLALPASLSVVLAGRGGEVNFSVTGPPEYIVLGGDPVLIIFETPVLSLGADTLQPAWLHSEREVTVPSSVVDPVNVTIRSLDPSTVRVASRQSDVGAAQIVTQVEGGTANAFYWLSGVPGASGRSALVVAEAAGYAPDTMLVTVTRPAYTLSQEVAGGLPASGGEDPVFVLSLGQNLGEGTLIPMAVSPGTTPPEFTLRADQPSIAGVQFFASAVTVGADQGPANTVTFALQSGQNSTSTGQFVGTPASLRAARTGLGGDAVITMDAAPAEFDGIQRSVFFFFTAPAVPVIEVVPASLTFSMDAGGANPLPQTLGITNLGGGTLSGISVTTAVVGLPGDWLQATLAEPTAPTAVDVSLRTTGIQAGTYTGTITIASSVPGVLSVVVPVTLVVAAPVPEKLDLGPDRTHPAWLQDERVVALPSTVADGLMVTVRSLDPGGLHVTSRQYVAGAALDSVQVEGGTSEALYWIQGLEGAAGRAVTIIAEAPGYLPDTMVVTLTRPSFRLAFGGPPSVPAAGGDDPVMLLSVGDVINDTFIPLAVSVGSEAPLFTLTSGAPTIAQVRFVAGPGVTGADQGPADQITFGIAGGTNTTASGVFVGSPANLVLARTGTAGVVQVDAAAVGVLDFSGFTTGVQYTLTAPVVPIIVALPDSLGFTAPTLSASPVSQQVAVTNGGAGTLSGLAVEVLYGAGASDWLSVAFDSTTAPATMTVVAFAEFLQPGTFSATIGVTSTVPGVAPRIIPVSIVVTDVDRIEIVSGDGQAVEWGEFAPDSLKVRVLLADGTPLGDAFVQFTVSANGGTVSPESEVTDGDGYVATRWLMGLDLGTYTVTASRNGFRSAVFTGTSIAGASVTRVQITAPRTALTGPGDGVRFTAAAYNLADSLIGSAVIAWESRTPAVATVSATGLVEGVAGGQSWIVASSGDGADSVLVTVAAPPPCDVGFGSLTVAGAPATVGNAFCPERTIAPGAPNGDGDVTAFWFETFDYGNGAYFESMTVSYDPTTGVVASVTHYLNDPLRAITLSCSPLPSAPPPCTGVSVDLANRLITFTNLVLGASGPITLNGTLSIPAPPVVGLTKISGDTQSATVGTTLAAPMVVRLTDANGDPIANAIVSWAARYGCCNTIENVSTTTDADGVARYTPTMPTIALPVTVDVNSAGAPGSPLSFTATPIPEPAAQLAFALNTGGGVAGRTLAPGWSIQARDRFANVDVNFSGPITVVLFNGPTAIATLSGTTTRNAVNGVADFGDLSVNVPNSSWVLNASSPGLAGAQSAAFSIGIEARMTLLNTPLVPLGGTATLRVETSVPSYGTGLVVGLAPNGAGVVSVNAPSSVTLPVGDSIADFTITGVSNGFMFLNATVDGVGAGQLGVTVSSNTISVPLTLNVPYTRTASLPINLTQPAPVGGTTIAVTSANPAIANILTPSVFIAAGTLSGNAQLEGLALGQVAVTATGPNLATGTSSVRVTAALDIIESSATINAGFSSATVTTRLLSGGTVFSAPAGGIPLTFTSRDPACVAAPADIAVPTGLNSIATVAPYGGTAVTPCSTYLVVTSSQFAADSMRITVNAPPLSYLSIGATVGAGLTRSASYSLQVVAPAGGVVVRLTSSDPSRLVLSPSAATPGTASIDMPIAAGGYYGSFFFSGIEGQAGTTASVSMEVIGGPYTNPASATVTINPIGIEASGGTSFTTLAADGSGTVYVGELTPAGPSQSVTNESVIRAGGQAVTVTLATDDTEVVLPVTAGIAAASRTVTIVPGQSRTGYGIRPTGAGTATIRATSPDAGTPVRANYPATITVSAPLSYLSVGATIGAGLTRSASFSFQTVAPPGGIVVTLTSSDPTRLVLAPDAATPGTASIDVTIPAGGYYATFFYSGIEGQAGTSAQVSMTVQGGLYTNPAPETVTVNPIGIEASGSTSFTTLGADGSGVVYVGEIGPAGPSQSVSNESVVRAGGQPISVTLTSSAAGVVVPVTAGVAASPRTVTIAPGQSRVNYGLRPTGAGTASIGATSPEAATPIRANYPATITVSAPLSYLSVGATVGAGLTRAASFSFQSVAPAGGVVVTLTSSDPTRVVLAPDAATVGTASIDITIPAGSYYATFYYSGIEGQAGTSAQVSMSVAGGLYVDPAPATVTVGTLGVEASGSTTLTTLGNDGSGVVHVGELTAPGVGQYVGNESIIRAGGQPVVVTLTSTTPTVAVPLVAGVAASPRTVTIAPGQSRVNYGIRQLVAGTTTITAASATAATPVRANYPALITVTSPSSSVSIPTRLGAGLAAAGSFSLQVVAPVGGVTVTLTSSDPARLLLAPDATTAGAAQITLPIAQGGYYTSFVVMALEDVTGNPTVTAQTPGFTDATATSSVEPIGVQWNGATSLTTLASDGGGTAWVGIVSGLAGNQSISPEQVVRFGGVARTLTFTSSNTAVLLPVVAGLAQQGITTTIAPGQSRATVNVRPVSAGTATLAVSGNGLVSAVSPTLPQTVTVTVPLQYLSLGSLSQGAGLSQAGSVSLQTVAPVGGRTMTLTSSDPSRLLLAPDANTAGAGQIAIAFAAGGYYANVVVMSPENVTGSVTLTVSTPGYRDTTFTFTVVQPAVTLNGPPPTRTIAQGDDWFQAQVGVPSGNGVLAQPVRFGAPAPLTVTLASSVPAVGSLVIGGVVGSPQEITIPAGQSLTSAVVATRANFRPLSAGNTTVTATIPGFLQQGNAIRTVTVTP